MRYREDYYDCYDCTVVYDNRGIIREEEISEISFYCLKNNTFDLIEENQDIDIQSIEELDISRGQQCYELAIKINEIIRVVNRQIKEDK